MNLCRHGIPRPPPRPPMILLATFTVSLRLSFLEFSRSHELCLDFTFPSDAAQTDDAMSASLLRCPAWQSERICSPDRSIPDRIDALGLPSGPCLDNFMAPMLCSILDAWSAHLYDGETGTVRSVPFLCVDFAADLYEECKIEEMFSNPFLSDVAASNAVNVDGRIASKYLTKTSFVSAFAAIDEDASYCFSGGPYIPQPPGQVDSPSDMCVERLSNLDITKAWNQVNQNEVWIQFESVPGLPGIVALGSHNGYVGIYRVNDFGTAPTKLSTLIDMSGFVHNPSSKSDERGLLGIAFHKEFATNGRVFMSYSCGRNQSDRCGNQGDTAIEELHAPDPTNPGALVVDETRPVKVIFKYPQDRGNHNGAPILFRPTDSDPYLYILLGDGGGSGDPRNRSQDVSSLLGKALRIDVDSVPPEGSTYVIPPTNPFVNVPSVRNEIYAFGLRNSWKASFDPLNPTYFYVADVGQGRMEEIDLLVKGSNFGWPRYEGTLLYSNRALAPQSDSHRPPVATYTHTDNNANGRASVTGGHVVRTKVDPSLTGSYVFADLYDRIYVTTENPIDSGQFTNPTRIEPLCSRNSPLTCTSGTQNYIMTFGVDSYQNVYFVSEKGLHRLVPPCLCSERDCAGVDMRLDQSTVPDALPPSVPIVKKKKKIRRRGDINWVRDPP